jgi:hypothetical protein
VKRPARIPGVVESDAPQVTKATEKPVDTETSEPILNGWIQVDGTSRFELYINGVKQER